MAQLEDLSDRCFAELEQLVESVASADLLEKCSGLLSLLPATLIGATASIFNKARVLRKEMLKVVDHAYLQRLENPDDKTAESILAASALLGLLTVDPGNVRVKPSQESRQPVASMEARQLLAGSWTLNGIGDRQVRTNAPKYLRAFQHALNDHLEKLSQAPHASSAEECSESGADGETGQSRPAESLTSSDSHTAQHNEQSEESTIVPPPEPKKEPSRRAFLGLAAGGVLGIGVAVFYASHPGGSSADDTNQSSVTISASAVRLKDEGNMTVVPGNFKPGAEMKRLFATPGAATDSSAVKDFLRREGVNHEEMTIRVTVAGPEGLEIVDIKPIISKKQEPLNGTLFLIGTQGQGGNRTIRASIDLDKQAPVARELIYSDETMASPTPGRPLFELETFPIGEETNGKRVFVIQAASLKYYVEFTLEFTYNLTGQDKTVTVDNGGKPFRVTGNRCDYEQVYVPQGDYSLALGQSPLCDE
ncbi:hypothetical protein F7R91_01635 [Streptomyces luteolifulvus]|uniref:Uncharacterized protein n=1 Tax=Streptomyces luteolifulvus TaxID=2615112 RepID=A0A6H9VB47_9ACTN|nr:hypothetical protein [Streptomyces luteolifulvus]KAB1150707.1 hypothetical protein F7R91_01635 [Streptomyces luteolifulvus]